MKNKIRILTFVTRFMGDNVAGLESQIFEEFSKIAKIRSPGHGPAILFPKIYSPCPGALLPGRGSRGERQPPFPETRSAGI